MSDENGASSNGVPEMTPEEFARSMHGQAVQQPVPVEGGPNLAYYQALAEQRRRTDAIEDQADALERQAKAIEDLAFEKEMARKYPPMEPLLPEPAPASAPWLAPPPLLPNRSLGSLGEQEALNREWISGVAAGFVAGVAAACLFNWLLGSRR
jgi:hypothetical protein